MERFIQGVPSHEADRNPYFHSNEGELYRVFPYLKELSGAILGVGSDQVFDFMANTSLSRAVLIDYSELNCLLMKSLVDVGIAHRQNFGQDPKPDEFIQYFQKSRLKNLVNILSNSFSPKQITKISDLINRDTIFNPGGLPYEELMRIRINRKGRMKEPFAWYSTKDKLSKIIDAYEQGRITIVNMNLLDGEGLLSVAQEAKESGFIFDTIYLSNVEETENALLSETTRKLWQALLDFPISSRAVIVRSALRGIPAQFRLESDDNYPMGFKSLYFPWHYNIESINHHQASAWLDPEYTDRGWMKLVRSGLKPALKDNMGISILE
jgi:hypothetical protein